MRPILSLSLLLLSGCATIPASPAAQARARISWRLRACLEATRNRSYFERRYCLLDEENDCSTAGLESGCGTDDLYTNPPYPVR